MKRKEGRGAYLYHDGSILTVVDLNPSHANKRKKDRESLVALLVLTIEFRREERRETIFVPWNGSLSKVSLSLQKSPIAEGSRSLLQVLD